MTSRLVWVNTGPTAVSEFTTEDQIPVLDSLDDATNYADWIVAEMAPFLDGSILEIGAGTGTMSERLKEFGRLTTTEPDPLLARRLDRRLHETDVEVLQCDWGRATEGFHGDSVVAINVLEHISDDGQALAQAYDSLEPGGTLCVFVPAFQLLFSEFDASIGHYRRYRKPDLVAKMSAAGFQIEAAKYMNSVGWFAWLLLARILRRPPAIGSKVAFFDRWVIPWVRRAEEWISPPFGQSVLVVGRRPHR